MYLSFALSWDHRAQPKESEETAPEFGGKCQVTWLLETFCCPRLSPARNSDSRLEAVTQRTEDETQEKVIGRESEEDHTLPRDSH